jgi:hypothetical protein
MSYRARCRDLASKSTESEVRSSAMDGSWISSTTRNRGDYRSSSSSQKKSAGRNRRSSVTLKIYAAVCWWARLCMAALSERAATGNPKKTPEKNRSPIRSRRKKGSPATYEAVNPAQVIG